MAQAIVTRLHRHRFQHRVVLLDYPRAGHGVGPLAPNEIGHYAMLHGYYADSNDEAAAGGWPKLLGFLRAFSQAS